MKIALTATGSTPDSDLDQRFGRAKYFVIYDTETDTWESRDNSINLNAMQGAGIQAAKQITDTGAQAVVTGNVGPKAFAVLEKAGVRVFTGARGTVKEALESYNAGALNASDRANVEGHWS